MIVSLFLCLFVYHHCIGWLCTTSKLDHLFFFFSFPSSGLLSVFLLFRDRLNMACPEPLTFPQLWIFSDDLLPHLLPHLFYFLSNHLSLSVITPCPAILGPIYLFRPNRPSVLLSAQSSVRVCDLTIRVTYLWLLRISCASLSVYLLPYLNPICSPIYSPILSPILLWSKTAKNTDRSTGPLACPFARSLSPLTRSLLQTARFARALRCAHSLLSLPRSWESELLDGYFICVFPYFRP